MSFEAGVKQVFPDRRCLEGIKVADFMWHAVGGWGTSMLASFGADAVERWFTTDEVNEMLVFVESLTVARD